MRLIALTALTMVAFAANSILNRLALADEAIGPSDFAMIRLTSGAMALVVLAYLARGAVPLHMIRRPWGALALTLYFLGFSYAYLTLDAGVGALILFGGVQITMFAGGLATGERPPTGRWVGAMIALSGLAWLLWPVGLVRPDPTGALLMAGAAVGWGLYSLLGRRSGPPLPATAANFVLAIPITLLVCLQFPDAVAISAYGTGLAILSGVVTSGLGYALWYSVLPQLEASTAALAQLTVPVIATVGGIVLLSEGVALRELLAGALVLGGVALGTSAASARSAPADRK